MITVYGKPSCGKCNKFKQKLPLLGLVKHKDWEGFDVSDLQAMWEDGKQAEARSAMSALAIVHDELPAIEFSDGEVVGYSEAVKAIKKGRR